MSTSVLTLGTSPCFVSRRRSASAAFRYRVGSTPNAANTRRHGGDARQGSHRPGSESLECLFLLDAERIGESGRRRPVPHALGADEALTVVGNCSSTASS